MDEHLWSHFWSPGEWNRSGLCIEAINEWSVISSPNHHQLGWTKYMFNPFWAICGTLGFHQTPGSAFKLHQACGKSDMKTPIPISLHTHLHTQVLPHQNLSKTISLHSQFTLPDGWILVWSHSHHSRGEFSFGDCCQACLCLFSIGRRTLSQKIDRIGWFSARDRKWDGAYFTFISLTLV